MLIPDMLLTPVAVSLFASVVCGVIGTLTVARRSTYVAGAVAHSAFAGIGLAEFAGIGWLTADAGALAAICAVSVFLGRYGENKDSALSAVWSVGMAVGLVFLSLTDGYQSGLMTYMFGSIVMTTPADAAMVFAVASAAVLLVMLFKHGIASVCFDAALAKESGQPVGLYELVISLATGLAVFVLSKAVGIVLVIALLTLPAVAGLTVGRRVTSAMIFSGMFAFVSLIFGICVSWFADIAASPPIVLCAAFLCAAVKLGAWLKVMMHRGKEVCAGTVHKTA